MRSLGELDGQARMSMQQAIRSSAYTPADIYEMTYMKLDIEESIYVFIFYLF